MAIQSSWCELMEAMYDVSSRTRADAKKYLSQMVSIADRDPAVFNELLGTALASLATKSINVISGSISTLTALVFRCVNACDDETRRKILDVVSVVDFGRSPQVARSVIRFARLLLQRSEKGRFLNDVVSFSVNNVLKHGVVRSGCRQRVKRLLEKIAGKIGWIRLGKVVPAQHYPLVKSVRKACNKRAREVASRTGKDTTGSHSEDEGFGDEGFEDSAVDLQPGTFEAPAVSFDDDEAAFASDSDQGLSDASDDYKGDSDQAEDSPKRNGVSSKPAMPVRVSSKPIDRDVDSDDEELFADAEDRKISSIVSKLQASSALASSSGATFGALKAPSSKKLDLNSDNESEDEDKTGGKRQKTNQGADSGRSISTFRDAMDKIELPSRKTDNWSELTLEDLAGPNQKRLQAAGLAKRGNQKNKRSRDMMRAGSFADSRTADQGNNAARDGAIGSRPRFSKGHRKFGSQVASGRNVGDCKRRGEKFQPFSYVRLNPGLAREKFKRASMDSFSHLIKKKTRDHRK